MRDRTPSPGKENRVRIIQDNGQIVEGVLSYADDATQEGSAYTKGNVLPDDVCGILGLDSVTAEPKDAWLGVIKALGYCILTITVLDIDGTLMSNIQVSGLTGVVEEKTYTDALGKIFLLMNEGEYTLSVPEMDGCVDATLSPKMISIRAGELKAITFQPKSKNITSAMFSSSENIKFSSNVRNLDVFCCGGGGGGGGGGCVGSSNTSTPSGGGGGGGGRTATKLGVNFTPYQEYQVSIGSAGNGGSGAINNGSAGRGGNGGRGGSTSFMGVSASGGSGGTGGDWYTGEDNGDGGNGGSGGGGGSSSSSNVGAGGSDGEDGEDGYRSSGGVGQGTTTKAFGETSGMLCAGGGDGGYLNTTGSNGGGKYGYGGGGGGSRKGNSSNGYAGKSGYSGVVMIRWVNKI